MRYIDDKTENTINKMLRRGNIETSAITPDLLRTIVYIDNIRKDLSHVKKAITREKA